MLLTAQILCLLLGVFFFVSGWLKVLGNDHMVREFQKFGYPQWLRVFAGFIEVVAAPMMLSVIWFPQWAALGALILCPVMVGAAWTNFVKRPAAFGWGTVVILLLCVVPVVVHQQALLTMMNTAMALAAQ
jgi:putative oxidoreductase